MDTLATSEYIARSINQTSHMVAWQLQNMTSLNESRWMPMAELTMNRFVTDVYQLYKQLNHSQIDRSVGDKWAFNRAFFFAATTLTSIGEYLEALC